MNDASTTQPMQAAGADVSETDTGHGKHRGPVSSQATDTDEGGRGLQLITALSRRWGTRYTANGKCIWTEQDLAGAENPRDDPSEALARMFPVVGDFAGDLDALPFGDQEP